MSSQRGLRDVVLPRHVRAVYLRHPKHFPSIQDFSRDGKGMEDCREARCPGHHRLRLLSGQLRLCVVSEAGSVSAALVRHDVPPQEARNPGADGLGSTETTFQGARLG